MIPKQRLYLASRVVILNDEGKIAVIQVQDGLYYKIPGGGVEEGETLEECAKREAKEESGCVIEIIAQLGESEFESSAEYGNMINHSTCFLARQVGACKLDLTHEEKENQFKPLWLTIEEAIPLFENIKSTDEWHINKNNRDLAFIRLAKSYIPNSKF